MVGFGTRSGRFGARWSVPALGGVGLALLCLAGCTKKSTAPVPQGRITGLVEIPGGGPVDNLDVSLCNVGGSLSNITLAFTNAGGQFTFVGLRPGSYVLYSHDFSAHCDADTAVVPDVPGNTAAETTSVVLTLRAGAWIRGTATLSGQSDHRGITVYVDQLLTLGTTDSTGAYQLTDVPTGAWNVIATKAGRADASTAVAVPAPGDTVTAPPLQLVPGAPSGHLVRR